MAKRVLLGKEGSNYVLKVSKPTVDVIDDTINDRDYLFNSEVYRAGVIRSNSTYATMTTSGVDLPTTSDSSGNAYIPAYIISEKGAFYPQASFDERWGGTTSGGFRTATFINCLSTAAGGGMFQFSLGSTSTTKNIVIPYEADAEFMSDPRPGEGSGTYPFLGARDRGSSDGDVKILIIGIPCQFGKMTNNTTLFGTSVLTGSAVSGGGGSSGGGGTVSAPTITSVSRTARTNSIDTVSVNASAGTNNSGTITYAQSTTDSASGATFGSSSSFTQPRNSTRYYFAKQSNLISDTGGGGSTTHIYVSAAVDSTPNAFSFTPVLNASLNSTNTSNTITIAGLGDGDTATVSLSGTAGSKQYSKNGGSYTSLSGTAQNGDTFAVRGTASASYASTVTVILTVGGVSGTYSISTQGVPADTTPDAFNFTNQSNLNLNTLIYSNTVTISGINQTVSVSATNGAQFSINGGSYVTSGSISNGQTLRIRLTSSGSYNTTTSTTVTVGGTSDAWSITTKAQAQATTPTLPSATLQTNTSSSTQTVRAAAIIASGDTLQIRVGTGGTWTNATSTYSSDLSQSRNTYVTYYFRAVSPDNDIRGEVSASLYIPPLHAVQAIADFNFTNGSHDNTYSVTSSLNGAAAGLYTGKSFSVTESVSWITATIANNTTGTMRLQISANTGSARSATVTYTISSTNGGPDVSESFTVSQDAGTPPVTAIWEVNITQGAYSPVASFVQQGIHPFTGGGYGSFSNSTNTVASINSNATNFAFFDTESSNTNTTLTIYTSSPANSGWTTLKVYDGTSTAGTLLGTFTRTSLSYSQTTQGTSVSNWDLGTDVTTSTGNRFLQFS